MVRLGVRSRVLGALAALVVALSAVSAAAQTPVAPSQPGNTLNQEKVSAVGATTVVTLGTPRVRAHLASLDYRCSSGTAQVTITDGTTVIWTSPPSIVGTTVGTKAWYPPLASTLGNNMTITLGSCGSRATGTLDVQGHSF